MCLAIPGTITRIEDGEAVVGYEGVSRRAELTLAPTAKVGDRVLVHAGFVIAVLTPEQGDELLAAVREATLRA